MISPRVANQMLGLGLLEAIPEATLLGLADPDDANGDGIPVIPIPSGMKSTSSSPSGVLAGRRQPTILQQVAEAFNGDIGITTSIISTQNCSAAQELPVQVLNGGVPEIETTICKVVLLRQRACRARQRDYDDPQVLRGETIFNAAQCQSCHVPTS